MNRLNMRWRLTMFYAAILSLILAIVGISLILALRESVHQTLDESLRFAANLAINQLTAEETKPRFETQADHFQTQLPGTTVLLVYNKTGRLTDQFGTPRVRVRLEAGFASVNDIRIYTERLSEGGWLQAMRSEVEILSVLQRVQRWSWFAVPLVLLMGFTGGYLVADRGLQPVDQVTTLASAIADSGTFKARVPETAGNDEMARLTQTFNAMLAKLEATFERERTFALAAAHELSTPLTILRGQANLSLQRPRSIQEYRQALCFIEESTLEMSQLVESLLTLARSNQPPVLLATNLEDLVLEVVENLSSAAHVRSIKLELQTQSAPVCGDPTALRLVVNNLLENAIKYTQVGGNVWLRTKTNTQEVMLEVSDNGFGVPSAELERLSHAFERGFGLQAVKGAGLGLALVKAVAEQHGGRLELGQALEGGLRATVRLPKAVKS